MRLREFLICLFVALLRFYFKTLVVIQHRLSLDGENLDTFLLLTLVGSG